MTCTTALSEDLVLSLFRLSLAMEKVQRSERAVGCFALLDLLDLLDCSVGYLWICRHNTHPSRT
jgi:hypothetical protein